MIKTYRKKSVEVEAVRWTGQNHDEIKAFCGDAADVGANITVDSKEYKAKRIIIYTLEGEMIASPGDYIIKGVAGECYPCKPKIFMQTYEEAEG